METAPNKLIVVSYELYVTEDGERDLVEKATPEQPFQFISGLGTTLDAFESQLTGLAIGDKFEFTISSTEAYGEYNEEHVIDLPKNIFEIDGRFDAERIFAGNVVPLMDADGNRMNATVVEVGNSNVKVDMNHPLAGEDLTFVGEVLESRTATNEEIQGMINVMSGEGGCGCGCDSCGDDCGCDDKEGHEGSCGSGCGCH
nr:FKBP-type peptidyl-prolyl cis-trans isomerase [uncultured Bacteroides sp.]